MARRRVGFLPAVDVAYTLDPPRAIVTAELAGIDPSRDRARDPGTQADPRGASGVRQVAETDVYQQVEIERGPFRRVIELGADVRAQEAKATYEDGMLRVELPLGVARRRPALPVPSGAGARSRTRHVTRTQAHDRGRRRRAPGPGSGGRRRRASCPQRGRRAAAARHGHVPGHADPAERRPAAERRADQRRAARGPLDRDGRQPQHRGRDARARTISTTSACSARWRG